MFRSNLWEYRDRVIAIRGYAPEALRILVNNNVKPDTIYIDADKKRHKRFSEWPSCFRIRLFAATIGVGPPLRPLIISQ